MLVKREFHNIECDCCRQLLDEETWWDDQYALTTTILPECGWIECEVVATIATSAGRTMMTTTS